MSFSPDAVKRSERSAEGHMTSARSPAAARAKILKEVKL